MKKGKRKFWTTILCSVGGLGLLIGTLTGVIDWPMQTRAAGAEMPTISVDRSPLNREGHLTTSYAPVVKKVEPCVVNVFTTKVIKGGGQGFNPLFNDPLFQQFFGHQFSNPRPRSYKERSLGSGVIISSNGYILTNNHVVDDADEVKVSIPSDNKEYKAKVVGKDRQTDIAVLKIDAHDLPHITFGDSDKLRVGDVVLAIGNPFGIGQTVTMGIVSALGRSGLDIEGYEDFIQTDAAINPGNSGGALVDAEGRLVGINTAILSRSGGNQGIGFAIPSDMARSVMEHLIKYGKITRGFLGVGIQELTSDLAKQFNAPANTKGVLIGDVGKDSAAAEAGIKSGDIIVAFNGQPVTSTEKLRWAVASTEPGKVVPVKVLRDGKDMTFEVKLKEMPSNLTSLQSGNNQNEESSALNGVTVTDLNANYRQQFNIPDDVQGALVTNVDPNSPSYDAGVRPGQVILDINHHRVHNADQAVEFSKHIRGKQILLRVWEKGFSRYIIVNENQNQ